MNPEFSKAIEIDYRFEEVQKLKFSVFDLDNATSTLDDDDFLGCLECTLGEVSECGQTGGLGGGKEGGRETQITDQGSSVNGNSNK